MREAGRRALEMRLIKDTDVRIVFPTQDAARPSANPTPARVEKNITKLLNQIVSAEIGLEVERGERRWVEFKTPFFLAPHTSPLRSCRRIFHA